MDMLGFSMIFKDCHGFTRILKDSRGPEVDLETPLQCLFEEIARRLHEKRLLNLLGALRKPPRMF